MQIQNTILNDELLTSRRVIKLYWLTIRLLEKTQKE